MYVLSSFLKVWYGEFCGFDTSRFPKTQILNPNHNIYKPSSALGDEMYILEMLIVSLSMALGSFADFGNLSPVPLKEPLQSPL